MTIISQNFSWNSLINYLHDLSVINEIHGYSHQLLGFATRRILITYLPEIDEIENFVRNWIGQFRFRETQIGRG